jgi:hypothetical protein
MSQVFLGITSLSLAAVLGLPDRSARAYSLQATDKRLAHRRRTPHNGENSFDMPVVHSLKQGHSTAGSSKLRESFCDNLLSNKAEDMLSHLQVWLMFERVSGSCSTGVSNPDQKHQTFLCPREVQVAHVVTKNLASNCKSSKIKHYGNSYEYHHSFYVEETGRMGQLCEPDDVSNRWRG